MGGRKAVYHGGGLPGFVSHFVGFPTMIVLTNIDDVHLPPVDEGMVRFYLPRGGT